MKNIFISLALIASIYSISHNNALAFPVGKPFKICNSAAAGCLAPGQNNIITLSWHPATSPFGQNVMWESFYAGHSGGSAYYFIVNIHTGMCLDVVNGAYHNGAQLKLNPCSSISTSQWWRAQDKFYGSTNIRNLPSGKCITAPLSGWNTWSGSPPIQFSCGNHNQTNQYWVYHMYP